MSRIEYLHLAAGSSLPTCNAVPRKVILLVEQDVIEEWRARVSEWIVASGCLYMMAWGRECSRWHDSVDIANLERFYFGDVPDEKSVMTTWHEDEPISEVLWYSHHCAYHPVVDLTETMILHIAAQPRRDELLRVYEDSK